MSDSRLVFSHDLSDFFRQELTEARTILRIDVPELAEYYLVNLLCEFARRDHAADLADEPLALLYKRALEANIPERKALLKNIGDLSLYVAGFFAQFIDRSSVDVHYYISMGGNAYGSLSNMMNSHRRGSVSSDVFLQLASGFTEFVDLLNEVSDRARAKADGDAELVRLYERWLRTGSQRVQRLLAERGLVVRDGGPPDEYLQ